jgi:conjugal transfer/entry exclusion protein
MEILTWHPPKHKPSMSISNLEAELLWIIRDAKALQKKIQVLQGQIKFAKKETPCA